MWQTRYAPVSNIHEENVRNWINDLYELARIAQGLTPPATPAVESTLEQTSRTDPGKYIGPAFGITCAILGVAVACIVGISMLLIFLSESGL